MEALVVCFAKGLEGAEYAAIDHASLRQPSTKNETMERCPGLSFGQISFGIRTRNAMPDLVATEVGPVAERLRELPAVGLHGLQLWVPACDPIRKGKTRRQTRLRSRTNGSDLLRSAASQRLAVGPPRCMYGETSTMRHSRSSSEYTRRSHRQMIHIDGALRHCPCNALPVPGRCVGCGQMWRVSTTTIEHGDTSPA